MKRISSFLLLLIILLPQTLLAYEDDYVYFSLNLPLSSKDQKINVNTRTPSEVRGLSFQRPTTLELGYQFDIAPKFGTDLSFVYRFSATGESDDIISSLFDSIFDCFLGFIGSCDDEGLTFKNAKFAPYGIQVVPTYTGKRFHLGLGAVFYNSESIVVKYEDETTDHIAFKSATGIVGKANYYFSNCCALTLTYEDVEFESKNNVTDIAGNTTNIVDGSNVAIGFKARF